jgi:hypothetical protein
VDRNNILAFALSMLVFAGYLMYQREQQSDLRSTVESATSVQAEGQLEPPRRPWPRTPAVEGSLPAWPARSGRWR